MSLVARRSPATDPGRLSGRRRLWRSPAVLGLSPDCHLLQGQRAQQPRRGPATCELRYQTELARFAHTQNRTFIFRHHSEPRPVSKACSFWLQIRFCRTRRGRGGHSWGQGLLMGCVGTLKVEVGILIQRCKKVYESCFLQLIRQLLLWADHF